MNKVSKAEFARLVGVSKQAVGKLTATGQLPLTPDKKIDLDHEMSRAYMARHAGPQEAASSKPKAHPQKVKKKPATEPQGKKVLSKEYPGGTLNMASAESVKSLKGQSRVEPQAKEDPNKLNRYNLDNMRIAQTIAKLKAETDFRRGDLIKKDSVKRTFDRLIAIDQAQWTQLGLRLAPEIVALLGVGDPTAEIRVRELIDDSCYRTLRHLKKELSDWLSAESKETKS